jgi:hypothetical protein
LILAAISLLALVPARGLPNYSPGEVPVGETKRAKEPKGVGKRKATAPA